MERVCTTHSGARNFKVQKIKPELLRCYIPKVPDSEHGRSQYLQCDAENEQTPHICKQPVYNAILG